MKRNASAYLLIALLCAWALPGHAQQRGVQSISAGELQHHLRFLAADEFLGRNTPSPALKIASKYLALMAEQYGLKPLMPDGSYYQEIPLEVTTVSESRSRLRVISDGGEQHFYFPESFGYRGRSIVPGTVYGEAVFLGYGLSAPDLDWDDYGERDVSGKIVILLDAQLPADHILRKAENRGVLAGRYSTARERGAAALITVIDSAQEAMLREGGYDFSNPPRSRVMESGGEALVSSPAVQFQQIEIRHHAAAAILGIAQEDLSRMLQDIGDGTRVSHPLPQGTSIEISLAVKKRTELTYNVVAYVEGADAALRDEYVLFGSHHDHLGTSYGKIYNGADDNGSGTVAMLELAQAMMIERPKRSVIFVWHTGEEKGLWGSYYFVAHSPVPVEKMSAELNMDMICRNDPHSIYLIGSNKLSSELDESIHAMNNACIGLHLDYTYEDPGHPDRFFFRSDQYPYIRYGIPGVWFFCGTTQDYHQETDTIDRVDFAKMERVTRLVYLTAMDIGNKPGMLKLDLDPRITSRGPHNMEINWRQALERRGR